MRFKNYIFNNRFLGFILFLSFMTLTSCGSYQYVSHDDDGIYDNQTPTQTTEQITTTPSNSNNYYAQYFSEKSAQYEAIPEEGAIFTDIDSYTSEEYSIDTTAINSYTEGRPAWGSFS